MSILGLLVGVVLGSVLLLLVLAVLCPPLAALAWAALLSALGVRE